MPRRISGDSAPERAQDPAAVPVRVVIVTLDNHLASAVDRAAVELRRSIPGLTIDFHTASDWSEDPASLERCKADIARGDIIVATMLFLDEHVRAIAPALEARREQCDALLCCFSAGEIVRLTKAGRFSMSTEARGVLAMLKRLRGSRKAGASSGRGQMRMLRQIPRMLRFIPGTAQDVRAYFLTLQYWLAGSQANVVGMVRMLVDRYAAGPRACLRGTLPAAAPECYPETGLYHPDLTERITDSAGRLPRPQAARGTVGLLIMRSYVLAGNTAHYDAVIRAFEAAGLAVVPAFAAGLDSRPAIEAHFFRNGRSAVDAVVSLTGFSLVGGPAYNDARAAEEVLARLDVPYVAAHAVEFQTLEQWAASARGLTPVEATMMVAIPEIDGATGPILFGGRSDAASADMPRDMRPQPDRIDRLVGRIDRLITLRRTPVAERRIAIVLFGFPPNAGATGTAAYLAVFESLFNTLTALRGAGYRIDMPDSVAALRAAILGGNAELFGTDANVVARISADDHVRNEPHLAEIEAQWGPAPGRHQSDGRSILVLGARFGNVLVGVQPAFGYEGDPMRLLFEAGFAPTHAFAAFYRYIREDFAAHAVLHFGTHGALEFMPGKQVSLSAACWPDRLIGDLPNIYLYAANNPSEGTIARRRSAATLVSYLTPPVAQAGLYRGLIDLKSSLQRWRAGSDLAAADRDALAGLIQTQAAALDLATDTPAWTAASEAEIADLWASLLELEYTLIPHGLHVIGRPASPDQRADLLVTVAQAAHGTALPREAAEALAAGSSAADVADIAGTAVSADVAEALARTARLLAEDHEIPAILRALDGRFVRPAPGGDLIRTTDILPTGRNLHGFDPFRIPSAFAVADGARQAERLLARHFEDTATLPESVAIVLWGTDNLKTEGGPIAQALALIGARPRFDSYGRLAGAELIPLEALGRPRIDVVMTLSGIFRDLLPLQTRLLAEACLLAAEADEPPDQNFVRKHALAYQATQGCDLETAALRVFSNADGAYGSNVNHLIDTGSWDNEDQLAETYSARKCFAYGRTGKPVRQPELLEAVLANVELTYQNLESVELGVTTVDHYFDSLGGISRSIARARGASVPVYIGDQTRGGGRVRTLAEQVALETRTRALNPKWYEGMLSHGYEGVRQIEAHVTNTLGWSATTGQVAPWVYEQLTRTFVLDPKMRARLAALNPKASSRVANRLIEAHERAYWTPDESTLSALRDAGDELEDRLEGLQAEAAA
ncbi:cobaltochelatase CobN subunit [Tepidamorphus gemmatus]|uniref:magnesium chelatase n=1 Tax=Tepidamorphus gemmatus TaxID=747076 RepID=A0A4R3LYN2_9HYPH|nr:magnesium chelatase subunit H [Tepidamorphus gemmatus]TCT04959.1 cobaltochelatase CobN subunit [Tepidamorphus gemmatus]